MEGYEKYESYDTKANMSDSFYENYDSNDDLNPYQMLNQMKSWNKAIYLHVEDVDSQLRSALTLTSDAIRAEVLDLRNDTWAEFSVQAGQISSKVAQTDYNGNTIASLINQTATTIQIAASKINLTGFVTVSDLGVNGTTTIHGNRLQTGTLTADKIQAYSITGDRMAFNTIGANQIAAGAISADKIQAYSITGDRLAFNTIGANQIAAGAINAGHIQSYSITATEIASGAIQAYHIAAGAITADMISTGYLSADRISGGSITSSQIWVSSDVQIGRNLYFGGTANGTRIDGRLGYFEVQTSTRIMLDAANIALVVSDLANATINGKRILTTDDL